MSVEVKIDTTGARVKLDKITPAVRASLRAVLPDLTRQLAAAVGSKMASELKSHRTLTVKQEMHESTKRLYGRVALVSPSANGLLPTYLEEGTRPHEIVGNPVLAFYWDRIGADVFFHKVNHPGTRAYQFLSRSLAEMSGEIKSEISDAVKAGVKTP